MKKFFLTIFVLIVLAIVGFVAYISFNYLEEKNSLKFTPIVSPSTNASSTEAIATSTDGYATSTIDISAWKTYSNQELGYSLKYPANLIVNYDEKSLILAFPKKLYFNWPLQDSVKITVNASSSCASQNIKKENGQNGQESSLTIGNNKYLRTQFLDVAAGNRYNTISYEIKENGICYSLVYFANGANGAGLYVDDPILIKKYDEQNVLDSKIVMDNVYGILRSFDFIVTPDGLLER